MHKIKHIAMSSAATLTTKFQTASGTTSAQELFVRRCITVIYKPRITMHNAKHPAIGHLEQCCLMNHDESRFTIWQSNVSLCVLDSWRMLPAWMHSATCRVCWRRNSGLGLFVLVWAQQQNKRFLLNLDHWLNRRHFWDCKYVFIPLKEGCMCGNIE